MKNFSFPYIYGHNESTFAFQLAKKNCFNPFLLVWCSAPGKALESVRRGQGLPYRTLPPRLMPLRQPNRLDGYGMGLPDRGARPAVQGEGRNDDPFNFRYKNLPRWGAQPTDTSLRPPLQCTTIEPKIYEQQSNLTAKLLKSII
ncbi:hypothetical protein AVEN_98050-1 [Araneus ventricosus]|uniref:Uncharacterized protein n=1 Tax=Araneus ventricosus TaxID=182803 RepID=A0A4Y2NLK9_ARAVE|nr:hypothetical protein AVEN_154290-1 [Araneus ventricosus]GBN45672.1 hypothetical protein AVEN_98050-1 [Araneus ventricosus]